MKHDIAAVIGWSVFWVLVIAGLLALLWEWQFFRHIFGL